MAIFCSLITATGTNRQYSRAVEYEINEAEKTITRVWEYQSKPEGYSAAMGSAQRLDNGEHGHRLGLGQRDGCF